MTDKAFFVQLAETMNQAWEVVKIPFIAAVVAFLRIAYDNKGERWQRQALEVALCSALAQAFHELLSLGGFNAPVFVSTAVGVIGVYPIRQALKSKFIKKIEKAGE